MTPQEKAKKLTYSFYNVIEHTLSEEYSKVDWQISKQCALIAVDEIISAIGFSVNDEYWLEVKQEIEKL